MRITSKGQVTIPQDLRERLGLMPNTEVEFIAERNGVRIVKARAQHGRGRSIVARLRGRGAVKMTTDAIMALTRSNR